MTYSKEKKKALGVFYSASPFKFTGEAAFAIV